MNNYRQNKTKQRSKKMSTKVTTENITSDGELLPNGTAIIFNPAKLGEIKKKMGDGHTVSDKLDEGLHVLPISKILMGVLDGKIRPYVHNRGLYGTVNSDTVNKVAHNLMPYSLQEILACKSKGGSVRIADGHGRIEGLFHRFLNGKLTVNEMGFLMGLRICPENKFQELYHTAADVHPHSSTQKILNPDFFYGETFLRLRNEVGIEVWACIKNKFLKNLEYIVYRFSDKGQVSGKPIYPSIVPYSSVFGVRNIAKSFELCTSKDTPFKLAEKDFIRLADSIRFYNDIMNEMRAIISENTATDMAPYKRLASSAPFMAILVLDYMSGIRRYGTSQIRLAKRIFKHMARISDLTKGLTYASTSSTFEHEGLIANILIGQGNKDD